MQPAGDELVTDALATLRQAEIAVVGGTLAEWSLKLPNGQHQMVAVRQSSRPPSPSALKHELAAHPDRRLIFVVRSAPESLRSQARAGLVDLVDVGSGVVIVGGREWAGAQSPKPLTKRRSRPAWGRWAVMRSLCLLDHPVDQAELAVRAGIAQPAVSLALHVLDGVTRTASGWIATDKERLMQSWIAEYPGAGGATTHWYGLDTPLKQIQDAATLAADLEVNCLLSGDAAADVYAPWRLPKKMQMYATEVIDFTAAGLTPASAGEATLSVTIPADLTIWKTAPQASAPGRLVDPLIAYWDLAHAGGPDAIEAADMVLRKVRTSWNA
jgi:hypothetical protein